MGLGSVLTLRPEWEGGSFRGSEEDRASLLMDALRTCPDHVDIELDMDDRLRGQLVIRAKELGVRTIISHHDLTITPSHDKMMDIIERCVGTGGDTAKLAVKCSSIEDAEALIHLAREASKKGFKYSIMGMGVHGHITRVLAPQMGCEMVYASMEKNAASDQIDIRTLKRIWELTGTGQWR
jgi:3-dehydroquinate dehydratase-1